MCGYAEAPQAWWPSTPRARKEHMCCECGSIITVGEVYHSFKSVFDGSFNTYKTCAICEKVRDKALKYLDVEDLAFGCLWETVGAKYEI